MSQILIVESDALAGQQLKNALERNGYRFFLERNGRDELWFLDQNPSDLLITEIDLPYLDGLNLVKGLKSHPEQVHLPIIFYVSDQSLLKEIQSQEIDVVGVVEKSQGLKALLDLVKTTLVQEPFLLD
jgi:DNA-binding response OmpR family regulator